MFTHDSESQKLLWPVRTTSILPSLTVLLECAAGPPPTHTATPTSPGGPWTRAASLHVTKDLAALWAHWHFLRGLQEPSAGVQGGVTGGPLTAVSDKPLAGGSKAHGAAQTLLE